MVWGACNLQKIHSLRAGNGRLHRGSGHLRSILSGTPLDGTGTSGCEHKGLLVVVDLIIKHPMENSCTWDGTLTVDDFHVAAKMFCERWKEFNSTLPPWTWIPCKRSLWGNSCKAEGYLSLENVHNVAFNEEQQAEDSSLGEEEHLDTATLVQSFDQETHIYDFHVVYSNSYRVPVLYFRGYLCDGQPLVLDDIKKDFPAYSSKILQELKWTFMTQEEHPYLNRPWFTLHPCGTSDWMKLLFCGQVLPTRDAVIQQYLLSWLSVVAQAVGLKIPLDMLKSSQSHSHTTWIKNMRNR